MVMGDATTAVVTHALREGSRLEECFGSPPAPDAWQDVRRGGEEMARAARRQGGSSSRKGRSSRVRSAQLEQLNLNAAGIDVGADAHWVAVPGRVLALGARQHAPLVTPLESLELFKLEHGVLEFFRDDGERRFAAGFAKVVGAAQDAEMPHDSGLRKWSRASKNDLPLLVKCCC
jgi:hypothetical protein